MPPCKRENGADALAPTLRSHAISIEREFRGQEIRGQYTYLPRVLIGFSLGNGYTVPGEAFRGQGNAKLLGVRSLILNF